MDGSGFWRVENCVGKLPETFFFFSYFLLITIWKSLNFLSLSVALEFSIWFSSYSFTSVIIFKPTSRSLHYIVWNPIWMSLMNIYLLTCKNVPIISLEKSLWRNWYHSWWHFLWWDKYKYKFEMALLPSFLFFSHSFLLFLLLFFFPLFVSYSCLLVSFSFFVICWIATHLINPATKVFLALSAVEYFYSVIIASCIL